MDAIKRVQLWLEKDNIKLARVKREGDHIVYVDAILGDKYEFLGVYDREWQLFKLQYVRKAGSRWVECDEIIDTNTGSLTQVLFPCLSQNREAALNGWFDYIGLIEG